MAIAIQQNPYDAFECISNMNSKKKKSFGTLVLEIVEFGNDIEHKTRMAMSLFDKTNIQYGVMNRNSYLDFSEQSQGRLKLVLVNLEK